MAPLRSKTFLLLFLLFIALISSGMVKGFNVDSMLHHYSLSKDNGTRMNMRKMLMLDVVLDYADAGANPKHDPKKPGPGGKP